MKKLAALIMAVILASACALSAMAAPEKWVDIDLEGYKVVFLFNYNEDIANNIKGNTPLESIGYLSTDIAVEETFPSCQDSKARDPFKDARYVISSIYAAGFEAREIISTATKDVNVVPVDLTVKENTAFVYPIATKSHIVIGLLYAKVNVEEGYLQVEGQLKDGIYNKTVNTLTIYTTRHQVLDGANDDFPFAEPISIAGELGGADAVLLSITGKVTYPTLYGNMKSGKTLSYQDYYRDEAWVRAYRDNLAPIRAKVAFR
ncbi:MAG: hypothetical protein IKP22_13425 [Clostridia bacterium]|nr:hypothetical protein [Clostridia bacterium]